MNENNNIRGDDATPSAADAPLSASEYEAYRRLLDDAFPAPKKSVRDGVMEQVKAERLRVADNRTSKTRRRKLFVRYGSLAACLIFMVGVVSGLLPLLRKMDANLAESSVEDSANAEGAHRNSISTYAADEKAPPVNATTGSASSTGSDSSIGSGDEKALPGDSNSATHGTNGRVDFFRIPPEAVEEEAAEAETEIETPQTPYSDSDDVESVESVETASDTAAAKTESDQSADDVLSIAALCERGALTNAAVCAVHGDAPHVFAEALIQYVGEDAFYDWYYSEEAADECGTPTVMTYAAYFGLDKEQFLALVEDSEIPYDIETIFPSFHALR